MIKQQIDTKEFVIELKRYGVAWSESEHRHLIGNEILTNYDMKIMCSNKYEDEYNKLNNTQRTKVRMEIFRSIRYGTNKI